MLYGFYEETEKKRTDFYEKHKSIFAEYDELKNEFTKELIKRLSGYMKVLPVKGKNEYDCEKEVDLKNYEIVKLAYIPEKDLIKILYRGTWTDADIRELFVEPESINITP